MATFGVAGCRLRINVVAVNVGDLLREEAKKATDRGNLIKGYIENPGALVPDEIVADLVKARVQMEDCANRGFVLRGFPRTKAQAEMLMQSVLSEAFSEPREA